MITTRNPWIDVDNQLISWLSAGTLNLNVMRVNAIQPEATAEEVFSVEEEIRSPPPTHLGRFLFLYVHNWLGQSCTTQCYMPICHRILKIIKKIKRFYFTRMC